MDILIVHSMVEAETAVQCLKLSLSDCVRGRLPLLSRCQSSFASIVGNDCFSSSFAKIICAKCARTWIHASRICTSPCTYICKIHKHITPVHAVLTNFFFWLAYIHMSRAQKECTFSRAVTIAGNKTEAMSSFLARTFPTAGTMSLT